jgi:hypothetical protein
MPSGLLYREEKTGFSTKILKGGKFLWDVLFSETPRQNGLESLEYLRTLFERYPLAKTSGKPRESASLEHFYRLI